MNLSGAKNINVTVVCGNKEPFCFPSSDLLCEHTGTFRFTVTKPKLPTTFPGVQSPMDAEGHSFTHPFCIVYT